MNAFILIVWFVTTNGTAITTAEFSSLERCEAARKTYMEHNDSWARNAGALCVAK